MAEHPERPKDIAKIPNTLERRAHLIVDMLEDRAQHIVDAMDEPPPGTEEPTPDEVRAMWSFSPYGTQAPTVFWTLLGLTLEKLLSEVMAQPQLSGEERMKAIRAAHQQAEIATLNRVYPHRAGLMMLGITTPERSVELAKHAQRLSEQEPRRPAKPEPEPEVAMYA
jgi:hypothetical protein